MNIFNIKRAFEQRKTRDWEYLYIAFDLHDTVCTGTYLFNNKGAKLYPGAKEVLSYLNRLGYVKLILWTSSHPEPIRDVLIWLESEGIKFDSINQNGWEVSTSLCDFSKKFYFNSVIDDKGCWEGETDFYLLALELEKITGDKIIDWTDEKIALVMKSVEGFQYHKLFLRESNWKS